MRIADSPARTLSRDSGRRTPIHGRVRVAALAHCCLLISILLLGACGGGGGSSAGNANAGAPAPLPQPEPEPEQLSGTVMLGPAQGLDVRVHGVGLDIATRTDATGTFGPIEIPADYEGPLYIEARGGPAASYACDSPFGCRAPDETVYAFTEDVPFAATLKLYLEQSRELPEPVTVSPFSTAAADRADALARAAAGAVGGDEEPEPSVEEIRQANAEMDNLLRAFLGELPTELQLSRPYYTQPLADLTGSAAGAGDGAATILALVGTGLLHAADLIQDIQRITAEDVVAGMSRSFARDGELPVATDADGDVSLERLAIGIALVVNGWDILRLRGEPFAQRINESLAPVTLLDLADAVFAALDDYEWLGTVQQVPESLRVTDETLDSPVMSIAIGTSDGVTLPAERFSARSNTSMIKPRVTSRGDQLYLDLFVEGGRTAGRVFESEAVLLRVADTDGKYLSLYMDIDVSLDLVGLQVDAADVQVHERDRVALSVSSNRPGVSYQWRQIDGPEVVISGAGTATPSFAAPDLTEDVVVALEVTATDRFGNESSSAVEALVAAFPPIEDVALEDAALAGCLASEIAARPVEDAGFVTGIGCPDAGVGSIGGIGALANLEQLDVSGGEFLGSLRELADLHALKMLDVSGQRFVTCADIETVREANPGIDVRGEETCKRATFVELFGQGYDLVIGPGRERLFVAIPDRRQVAVIDANSFDLERFITFPGEPHGLSVSLDGDRLFVAVQGTNAIAVVSLGDLSYSLIPLGTAMTSPDPSAVREVQPGRLLVTSASHGFPVQVRLDQLNAVSRVADGREISAFDIAFDAAGQVAYLSGGQIYKLDASDPHAPVVAEVFGSDLGQIALSADGRHLATGSGRVFDTARMVEGPVFLNRRGAVAAGASDRFYLADGGNDRLLIFDFDESMPIGDVPLGCRGGGVKSLEVLSEDDADFVWISGDRLCVRAARPAEVLDPDPQFAMPDSQLEACVRAAAEAAGVTDIRDIETLDCSEYAGIASLDSTRRLSGLDKFYSRGGTFFDLEPLNQRVLTEFAALDNPALADLTGLLHQRLLASIDVTGSPRVPCEQLEALRQQGASVREDGCRETERLLLGGVGQDIAVDPLRRVYYVSVPELQVVKVIDAASFAEEKVYSIAGAPARLDLSSDGNRLVVATDRGLVSTIDLASGTSSDVDVAAMLGINQVWEVAEIAPGELLVAGNPPLLAESYLVRVAADGTQSRVAGGAEIGRTPRLLVDRDRGFAYVGNGFRFDFIHKLDIRNPAVPSILETLPFSVRGTHSLTLTADGSELFTQGGQRVSTETLLQTGVVEVGRSQVLPNGILGTLPFISFGDPASVEYLELESLSAIGRSYGGCALGGFSDDPGTLATDGEWLLILWKDQLCRVPASPFR